MFRKYLWGIGVSLSQLLNALLGGDPDETTSSRSARMAHRSGWGALARFLEWIDPGHGKRAMEADSDQGDDAAFPNL